MIVGEEEAEKEGDEEEENRTLLWHFLPPTTYATTDSAPRLQIKLTRARIQGTIALTDASSKDRFLSLFLTCP